MDSSVLWESEAGEVGCVLFWDPVRAAIEYIDVAKAQP